MHFNAWRPGERGTGIGMGMTEIGKKIIGSSAQMGKRSEVVLPVQQLPATMSDSDECLLAAHGRTFHFASRFLSPKLRCHVITLYAFFRLLDDLVDTPPQGRRVEDIRVELEDWRRWFTGSRSHPAPQELLGTKLATIQAEHGIPTALFLDFLDGMASDLEPQEMRDFGELYRYCYRVAGTVGQAMTHILGVSSTQALVAAENLGIGMQLTNILRDVGDDLAADRIYLPQDDLARFGCSRTRLLQLYRDQRGPDDCFRALMRYQVARAHRYYARGMSGVWLLPVDCRLPILVAGRLYRRILTAIERKGYDVLRSRAATSFPEKVREAAIAFMLDRLWRRGEAFPSTEAEAFLEG
jgi:phytoene synthase